MDTQAAVATFGDPADPAILLLHGIRLGRDVWDSHATVLSRRYYVIALDLPGHGALTDVAFTEENITALLDEVLDRIPGAPPMIVGYSLGGFVAMHYASRFPERTAAMLLAGCTLDFEGWKWWPYGATVRLSQMLPDSWLSAMVHAGLWLTLPRNWLEVVERIPFDRDVLTRTSIMVRSSVDAIDTVGEYHKPVLVVNGERDFIFRLDERRFLHRLPQARLRIMRGMDHTGPLRQPEEFAAIIDHFAEKVFAPALPIA